jgi:hypothetical protein
MHRLSDNALEQRRKNRDSTDSTEDPEIMQAAENRAQRDASAKWTLVQLPFRIFSPVLQK